MIILLIIIDILLYIYILYRNNKTLFFIFSVTNWSKYGFLVFFKEYNFSSIVGLLRLLVMAFTIIFTLVSIIARATQAHFVED